MTDDYNFDHIIDRHNTYSTQWDYIQDRFGRNDILPFSISDTDFPVPNEVQDALKERMKHPIYGYSRWNHSDYKDSIVNWYKKQHDVDMNPDWIAYSPSVGFSVASMIRLNSQPGDGVVVFTPMYDAFYNIIQGNNRRIAAVRLLAADKDYKIDWDTLELYLKDPNNTVFLLTNPHNPTGKVFSKSELTKLAQLCKRNNVFIVSDDIHGDIVYEGAKYIPITSVTTEKVTICTSASKTFNIPGLIGSYMFCPEPELLNRFLFELKQKNALSSVSIFGMMAQMAAYNHSDEYLTELKAYLKDNMDFVAKYLEKKVPLINFTEPQSTYLAWMNVSALHLSSEELQDKLVNIGKVGIMPGKTYGDSNYLRMNVGCPRSKVKDGLDRLIFALNH
ncbi:cystathionine beta-lyase [Lactobacillus selangorensis]|uniref:cysteine-S-conjugate beta-lyase n=1 Tax=Lactobacillus selangorensis TaxID=81857 RepID=A0A0R2FR81_9LACO|nr:MalY/PatB family protein [Lactobacillus selangorensis]KRN27923.1 cystathionine beta-lyase [Lactobacillus selangorensis]KRN30606.1 cystathionine beta-lyase [Lactobacillus selangorensis]